jgi:uncharacterized protein
MDPERRTYDKHWIPWTREQLSHQGMRVETPLMPEPWAPSYEAYREVIERFDIGEETALVGHSCGSAFLVRWLGETKRKVSKLILVAPWKILEEHEKGDAWREEFYGFPIDMSISSRVGEIIMFTSDDEEADGKESLRIFHEALGGMIVNLSNHGHYTQGHMGTVESPELMEVILK